MSQTTADLLRASLASLNPLAISIKDESHRHVGHAGANGGGHFRLEIISAAFTGKNTVTRHRMVYDAAQNLMHQEIHALSIGAFAPNEV